MLDIPIVFKNAIVRNHQMLGSLMKMVILSKYPLPSSGHGINLTHCHKKICHSPPFETRKYVGKSRCLIYFKKVWSCNCESCISCSNSSISSGIVLTNIHILSLRVLSRNSDLDFVADIVSMSAVGGVGWLVGDVIVRISLSVCH